MEHAGSILSLVVEFPSISSAMSSMDELLLGEVGESTPSLDGYGAMVFGSGMACIALGNEGDEEQIARWCLCLSD